MNNNFENQMNQKMDLLYYQNKELINLVTLLTTKVNALETKLDQSLETSRLPPSNIIPEEEKVAVPLPVVKQIVKKTISYGENIAKFFDQHEVNYNSEKTVVENLNNLCEETEQAINIYADKELVYSHPEQRKKPINCKITKDKLTITTNPKLNFKRLDPQDNISNVKNANKNHFKQACEILQVQKDLLCHSQILSLVIKKPLQYTALEPMTDDEKYVTSLPIGNVMYLEKNDVYIEKGFSYDINSFHPYVLGNTDFSFPLRQGKATTLQHIDSTIPGIYAIKIKNNIKYFVQSKEDPEKVWYTHYAIQLLEQENIKYSLLEVEDGFNAIIYGKNDQIKSRDLFGDTIKNLYNERSNPVCKQIMQQLFGTMCSSSNPTKPISNDELTYEDLLKSKKGTFTEEIYHANDDLPGYKYDCARMKLFFYDYCRLHLFNTYFKKYTPIRIYVDSFILTERIDDELLGDGIGQLKKELKFTDVVYPKVNHSFKTNPCKGVKEWDKEKGKYVTIKL